MRWPYKWPCKQCGDKVVVFLLKDEVCPSCVVKNNGLNITITVTEVPLDRTLH